MANPTSEHKLDFEQRQRASSLESQLNEGDLDPSALAFELIYLRDRSVKLERLLALAVELCNAVDCEAIDVGGNRKSLTILQDIGPLSRELERK